MEKKEWLTAARIVQVLAGAMLAALLLGEAAGLLPPGAGRACLDALKPYVS